MSEIIKNSLQEAVDNVMRFASEAASYEALNEASLIIAEALKKGGKVVTCGNGGSLCDATHFAEELTGRFRKNRRPLAAIAMNDPAHITCVANDYSYDEIYAKYIEAVCNHEDVLIGFSTSGNSENIVKAAQMAKSKGMKVIGMTRHGENKLAELSDVTIAVSHSGYSDRVQEIHIMAVHIIIENLEHLLELDKP